MSLIWLELLLGFGAPVGWGVWQLYTLRRDREAAARRAQGPGPSASSVPAPPSPPSPPSPPFGDA